MDTVAVKLNVLIDGMVKKENALIEIVNITENQSTVLNSGLTEEEIRAFMLQMNREKQMAIKTVMQCDTMFENILKEIGPELDARPGLYGPQIADLQQRIKRVMDLDVKIRVCETQNNGKMGAAAPSGAKLPGMSNPPGKKSTVIHDENRLIKAYQDNTRNFKG